jgi:hypothetical protein
MELMYSEIENAFEFIVFGLFSFHAIKAEKHFGFLYKKK